MTTVEGCYKININSEKICFEKTVYLSDLDIVNHTNNEIPRMVSGSSWMQERSWIGNCKFWNEFHRLSLNDTVVIHESEATDTTF